MKKLINKIVKAIENQQIQLNPYQIFCIIFTLLNTAIAIVKLFI